MNSPQMREVPNGCIKIDAQPCGLGAMRESHSVFANVRHYDGESPKTHGCGLKVKTDVKEKDKPKSLREGKA